MFLVAAPMGCSSENATVSGPGTYRVSQLEDAENAKDIGLIRAVFDNDAVLYTTDLMPVRGRSAVSAVYEFVFARGDVERSSYRVDTSFQDQNQWVEAGFLTTIKVDQEALRQEFQVVFENGKIVEVTFGDKDSIKRELPQMLPPTGKNEIGLATRFYDRERSGTGRMLSVQIWYPTNQASGNPAPFRSRKVVDAAARFLGMPLFAVSYFADIPSFSYSDVPVVPNESYPVLLYNHGYGGYTQVYQSVFEELASHGYVVVSVGHENESALLIQQNGEVLATDPHNAFYLKRAPEISNREIGEYQDIILSSDDERENHRAYQKLVELSPLHTESVRLWQSDTEAAVEKLADINKTDPLLRGAFDLESMGIFGHSLGGATAGQMAYDSPSIKAGINLDGFQFGDLINHKLKVPFLFVSSNEEGNRYLRATTFLAGSQAQADQNHIKGFSHDSFTDLKYILEGNSGAIQIQRDLIRDFFDRWLK